MTDHVDEPDGEHDVPDPERGAPWGTPTTADGGRSRYITFGPVGRLGAVADKAAPTQPEAPPTAPAISTT